MNVSPSGGHSSRSARLNAPPNRTHHHQSATLAEEVAAPLPAELITALADQVQTYYNLKGRDEAYLAALQSHCHAYARLHKIEMPITGVSTIFSTLAHVYAAAAQLPTAFTGDFGCACGLIDVNGYLGKQNRRCDNEIENIDGDEIELHKSTSSFQTVALSDLLFNKLSEIADKAICTMHITDSLSIKASLEKLAAIGHNSELRAIILAVGHLHGASGSAQDMLINGFVQHHLINVPPLKVLQALSAPFEQEKLILREFSRAPRSYNLAVNALLFILGVHAKVKPAVIMAASETPKTPGAITLLSPSLATLVLVEHANACEADNAENIDQSGSQDIPAAQASAEEVIAETPPSTNRRRSRQPPPPPTTFSATSEQIDRFFGQFSRIKALSSENHVKMLNLKVAKGLNNGCLDESDLIPGTYSITSGPKVKFTFNSLQAAQEWLLMYNDQVITAVQPQSQRAGHQVDVGTAALAAAKLYHQKVCDGWTTGDMEAVNVAAAGILEQLAKIPQDNAPIIAEAIAWAMSRQNSEAISLLKGVKAPTAKTSDTKSKRRAAKKKAKKPSVSSSSCSDSMDDDVFNVLLPTRPSNKEQALQLAEHSTSLLSEKGRKGETPPTVACYALMNSKRAHWKKLSAGEAPTTSPSRVHVAENLVLSVPKPLGEYALAAKDEQAFYKRRSEQLEYAFKHCQKTGDSTLMSQLHAFYNVLDAAISETDRVTRVCGNSDFTLIRSIQHQAWLMSAQRGVLIGEEDTAALITFAGHELQAHVARAAFGQSNNKSRKTNGTSSTDSKYGTCWNWRSNGSCAFGQKCKWVDSHTESARNSVSPSTKPSSSDGQSSVPPKQQATFDKMDTWRTTQQSRAEAFRGLPPAAPDQAWAKYFCGHCRWNKTHTSLQCSYEFGSVQKLMFAPAYKYYSDKGVTRNAKCAKDSMFSGTPFDFTPHWAKLKALNGQTAGTK
jgi:hypothetical protein